MGTLNKNNRLLILFRVLFNCRFYYPIYLVMFLDFGLTISEFATLNLVWAISIILLEVPSGAFADQVGRKKLVIISSVLMIFEIGILLLTPVGSGIVFWMFFFNRILSGAAEAAASGADEALAYDSIPKTNRESIWKKTMKHVMIMMSVGFILSSIIGALVYSEDFINSTLSAMGFDIIFSKNQTLKFPLYLNFITAIGTLFVALKFEENHKPSKEGNLNAVKESFSGTIKAGQWILHTPAASVLILIGLFYDSIIRVFYTVLSNIYRILKIPEWSWGFVGAVASIVGIGVAILCEKMVNKFTPSVNFGVVTFLTFLGCLAVSLAIPGWGIILLLPMFTSMRFLQYFLSHYLNKVTPSEQRATVLSFKGLSMNLAFGILTQVFGILTAKLYLTGKFDSLIDPELEAFKYCLKGWPIYFGLGCLALHIFIKIKYRKSLTKLISKNTI
ncbi:MAG: MFS transporter [Rickettsiales bacterium]|nr:MFS transporter [Rickettsiales bacterium]